MQYPYKKRLLNRLLIGSAILAAHLLLRHQVYADSGQLVPDVSEAVSTVEASSVAVESLTPVSDKEPNLLQVEEEGLVLTETVKVEEVLETSAEEVLETSHTVVPETDKKNLLSEDVYALKPETIYMSEKANLIDRLVLPDHVKSEELTWTLDGKPLEDWKTQAVVDREYKEGTFIQLDTHQNGPDHQITIQLNELFGVDPSQRIPKNIRRTYRHYIGEHELVGVSSDGLTVLKKTLTFRPYPSYRTHEEMQAEIEETRQNAASNRYVTIEEIGRSAEGRPIKMGIIAKDQATLDSYLDETSPKMLLQPDQFLKELEKGEATYHLPVLINNTHADEQPGIDIITSLFKTFSSEDTIQFNSQNGDGQLQTVDLNVTSLLDKFIFLFNFTENPDGDVKNLRTLPNGLDPNRDAGYQVNPETKATVQQINKWNPISVLDVHGFVKEFLIEPATPPHDPNFEYDLFSRFMLDHARAMGGAGIANSKYDSYVIPKVDWGTGWDDSFSGYTGVYAMYHGMLGHTLEIPEMNEESFKAGYFAVLGSIGYLSEHPEELMKARLAFYSRGINKIEDPAAEIELVGPDGKQVGRRKGNQPHFFPDYYVIPMSLDRENDLGQAFEMIEYFRRNGVIVQELTADTAGFKKGDLVIDMAQAKRGYANHILYTGSNESAWSEMYAEVVVNFPQMRGFKTQAIFEEDLFKDKVGPVSHKLAPRTSKVDHRAPYHVFANTSADAVRAVNQALSAGKKVYLTDDGYIVDTGTFKNLLSTFALQGEGLYKEPQGESLRPLKLYIPSHSHSWAGDFAIMADSALAMQSLGFELVETAAEADAIVLESKRFDPSIFGQKPVVVVGGVAMKQLEKLGILADFDAQEFKGGSSYEGLMRALIDDQDPLTSGYLANGLFYSNSGNWIETLPAGFKKLVSLALENHYVAGWWPGYEQLAGKIVAATGQFQGQPLTIYAGNPTNKVHTVHFFRWVSNALFGSKLASLIELPKEKQVAPLIILDVEGIVPIGEPGKYPTMEFLDTVGKQSTMEMVGQEERENLSSQEQAPMSSIIVYNRKWLQASQVSQRDQETAPLDQSSPSASSAQQQNHALPSTNSEASSWSLLGLATLLISLGLLVPHTKKQ